MSGIPVLFYRTAALLAAIAVIGSNSLSLGPIAPEIARNLAVPVEQILRASAAYGLERPLVRLFLRVGLIDMVLSALYALLFWF